VHPVMQPARGLPASAPLQREIAHVRSDLRPSGRAPGRAHGHARPYSLSSGRLWRTELAAKATSSALA
jgi:hypothetical protein